MSDIKSFKEAAKTINHLLQDDCVKFNGSGIEFVVDDITVKTNSESQFEIIGDDPSIVQIKSLDELYHFIIFRNIKAKSMEIYPDLYKIGMSELIPNDISYIKRQAKRSIHDVSPGKLFKDISNFPGKPLDVSNELDVSEQIVQTIRKLNHVKILNTAKLLAK